MSTSTTYAASAVLWILGLAAAGWGGGLVITAAVDRLTNRGGRK